MSEQSTIAKDPPKLAKTYGPLSAVVVTIVAYFGAQILASFIIFIYPLIRRWDADQANQWLSDSVAGQFIYILLVSVLTVVFILRFMKSRGKTWRDIGLSRPKLIDTMYAFSGFFVYFVIYLIVFALAQRYLNIDVDQKQEIGFSTSLGGISLVPVFISLVLLPATVEEIVTRGFLYTGLRSRLSKLTATLIASVLFAVAHLQFGSGNGLLWVAALDTFILSIILVYLREKSGRLYASIGLHMIKNSVAFVSLFVWHL